MKDRLKFNNFCSILFNKIFTSDVLCPKKCPQNSHFSNIDFRPPTLTCKLENNQKTKTDVHNFNASGIQIHLI